jgi:hypothetical protein
MLSNIIRNAIINAAANIEFTTKDEFMTALIESLFSGISVTVPIVAEKKPRKPRAKKNPESEAESTSEAAPESAAEDSGAEPAPEPEKKPRKPRAKKAVVVEETETETDAPAVEAEKPARKPRAKKEKDTTAAAQNMEKLNPTQTKKIKAIYEELNAGKDVDKKAILEFFNAMTPETFNSKKFEDHVRAFLAPPTAAATAELPASEDEGEEVFDVTFKGKKYIVSMDKKVYETDENGDATFVVGNVGMAEFAEMKLEE